MFIEFCVMVRSAEVPLHRRVGGWGWGCVLDCSAKVPLHRRVRGEGKVSRSYQLLVY